LEDKFFQCGIVTENRKRSYVSQNLVFRSSGKPMPVENYFSGGGRPKEAPASD
jgi:hypothetical protein